MAKSEYLETLEKLQNALTQFDMSFGVSNRIFRLALVSEIIDAACLFEQLYDSWCKHLPFGEGPDLDVDFTYWKELSSWESLLSGAKQNACIDDYPFDMGNGMTSDKIHGNRRKKYLRYVNSVLRRSGYAGNEVASVFVKTVNGDQTHMMTFGNMVFEALTPLLLTLSKIDSHLLNPDRSLYPDYFDQQKSRYKEIYDDYRGRIRNIMNENLPERRKCNKLNALKDEIWQNLYESKFLDVLKDGINTYDINDYRKDHPEAEKTEDEIREVLALEELVDCNMNPNKEKAGRYIFKQRKNLSFEDISTFYAYLFAIPLICTEVERLSGEKTAIPQQEINNANESKQINENNLSSSRNNILNQLLEWVAQGDWRQKETANKVKQMLLTILGIGPIQLSDKELVLSKALWLLLESGRGDREKIVWQNMVGYFDDKKLFNPKGSPALNKDFFGDEETYSNIDKGRPSRENMSSGFREVLPLLDKYCPNE